MAHDNLIYILRKSCQLPLPVTLVHTDLMQGQNPTDAFASLPPSMRGADETLDDAVSLEPLVQVAPGTKGPREQLWSLDKEQVCVQYSLLFTLLG